MQALHLVEGQIGARRIVWIGKKNHPGFGPHAFQHGIHIRRAVNFRRHNGSRPIGADGNRIDQKSMLRINRLIADTEVGMRQQLQKLIGTSAANNRSWIQAIAIGDGLAQRGSRAIGVEFKAAGFRRKRGSGQRRRAKGRLVRRKLVNPRTPGSAFSRRIGQYFQNAWIGGRPRNIAHDLLSMGLG